MFLQLRRAPRLDARIEDAWRARPQREFDATTDKPLMKITDDVPEGYWPIFKGESFDLWESDTGTFYAWGNPETLVVELQNRRIRGHRLEHSAFAEFTKSFVRNPGALPCWRPRIAFRRVFRASDSRTVRVALIPGNVFLTDKAPYFLWPRGDQRDEAYLVGVLSSLILDWYAWRFVELQVESTHSPSPVLCAIRSCGKGSWPLQDASQRRTIALPNGLKQSAFNMESCIRMKRRTGSPN